MNIKIFNRAGLRGLQLKDSCLATFHQQKHVMIKPFVSIPHEPSHSVRLVRTCYRDAVSDSVCFVMWAAAVVADNFEVVFGLYLSRNSGDCTNLPWLLVICLTWSTVEIMPFSTVRWSSQVSFWALKLLTLCRNNRNTILGKRKQWGSKWYSFCPLWYRTGLRTCRPLSCMCTP